MSLEEVLARCPSTRGRWRCAGIDAVRDVVEASARLGIKVLTLYAFSVENWKRPAAEVSTLMMLLKRYLRSELNTLLRNNIKFRVVGRMEDLAPDVQRELRDAEARTAANNARAVAEFDYDLGVNNFNITHTFNLSALYDLPFGTGKKHDFGGVGNAILGNWQVGLIANARSGVPLEIGIVRPDVVIQCQNAAGCTVPTGAGGVNTVFANGFVAQLPGTINAANPLPPGFIAVVNTPAGGSSRNVRRPDQVAGVSPYLTVDRLILNPAAFATPQPGTFGNVPRNFLSGPNFRQFDLVFDKRFKFSETTNLEFRTEVFNIFNHPNFDIPGSRLNLALPTVSLAGGVYTVSTSNVVQPGQAYTQGSAGGTFGLLRQTVVRDVGLGTSRQIQFALRLNF